MDAQQLIQELRDHGMEHIISQVEDSLSGTVLRFHTNLNLKLTAEDGTIKQEENIHNLITTAGKNKLLAVASGDQLTAFAYIAIGTNATAAAIGDTALGTEIARSPVQVPTNPTAAQYQVVYTFPAGTGTGAITEAGLLDAASVGTLLAHQVFAVINKAGTDTLQITWTIS